MKMKMTEALVVAHDWIYIVVSILVRCNDAYLSNNARTVVTNTCEGETTSRKIPLRISRERQG